MAVDIKDVEQVAQELQQKFDDFKAKNDKRVDAIEQEKGKLAGQVETLNGKLSELENLKSDLEKELLELKRPAGGAQNKLATEHKEAFVGFLRKGREDGLRDLERKALQVGTDEDGGYAVPEALDRNILTLLKDEVVMRQEATVITVGGSDYKKLVNLGGTASGWVGETDARSQTATSKLGLIEPFMGEIYGNPQATQKMLDDAFFNVEAWINSELATEFAEQEEIAFTSGDGTKKPKGFLAYESTDETDKVRAFGKLQHIVSGEATAVTADAIIKLIYTLRKAHRTGAKFMMNNNSLFAIRLLKDSEGIPLFVFHDNAVLFEVSLWIYPHFPPDLHYFRRLQAGVTDFRTRHFAACRLRLKKKVREPVAVWKHMNTRTATSPIPKIWEKSLSARPSQLMWWEMTALTSAIA